ncbi:histone-lysine N-methyltransferase [Thraustotheca clavata]|uniref:Histone-lysine N-methyltransferase n=1 Tax=Thraustotheca clavata TaxID=74557 RepID=A0A1W0A660_9STRA|nr:histone-lysine N-methyltransferase [Thraustotheca clavata]
MKQSSMWDYLPAPPAKIALPTLTQPMQEPPQDYNNAMPRAFLNSVIAPKQEIDAVENTPMSEEKIEGTMTETSTEKNAPRSSNLLSGLLNADEPTEELPKEEPEPVFKHHVADPEFVKSLKVGDLLDVKCLEDYYWYNSQVLGFEDGWILITFRGFSKKYDRYYSLDQWDCLAPEGTYAPKFDPTIHRPQKALRAPSSELAEAMALKEKQKREKSPTATTTTAKKRVSVKKEKKEKTTTVKKSRSAPMDPNNDQPPTKVSKINDYFGAIESAPQTSHNSMPPMPGISYPMVIPPSPESKAPSLELTTPSMAPSPNTTTQSIALSPNTTTQSIIASPDISSPSADPLPSVRYPKAITEAVKPVAEKSEPEEPYVYKGKLISELIEAMTNAAIKRTAALAAAPLKCTTDRELCELCLELEDEELTNLVYCDGPCQRVFHQGCLGIDATTDLSSTDPFYCDSCTAKEADCFLCGATGTINEDVICCNMKSCGRFYHVTCLVSNSLTKIFANGNFTCPAHCCATCDFKGKLFGCMLCPRSYHPQCVPPSARYNNVALICGKHNRSRPLPKVPDYHITLDGELILRDGKIRFPELYIPKTVPAFEDDIDKNHFRLGSHILDEYSTQVQHRPPKYQKLRKNKYLFKPPKNPDLEDMPMCICKDKCGDDCINRVSFVECVGSGRDGIFGKTKRERMFNCNVGPGCGNRAMQEANIPATKIIPCGSKGFGLKTLVPIKAGELVIEYVGEVITEEMKKQRLNELQDINWYIMQLTHNEFLDGRYKGSESRFINHSCEPNCHLLKWDVGEHKRIAITALRDIEAEEELSYDYQMETTAAAAFTCYCGAPSCRGTMAPDNFNKPKGEKVKKADKKPVKKAKKSRRKLKTEASGAQPAMASSPVVDERMDSIDASTATSPADEGTEDVNMSAQGQAEDDATQALSTLSLATTTQHVDQLKAWAKTLISTTVTAEVILQMTQAPTNKMPTSSPPELLPSQALYAMQTTPALPSELLPSQPLFTMQTTPAPCRAPQDPAVMCANTLTMTEVLTEDDPMGETSEASATEDTISEVSPSKTMEGSPLRMVALDDLSNPLLQATEQETIENAVRNCI